MKLKWKLFKQKVALQTLNPGAAHTRRLVPQQGTVCAHEEVDYSTLGDHWEGNHLETGLSQPEHAWDMTEFIQ